MTTIYIECSTTINSKFNTGIQRVVRNILQHSELVAAQLSVRCIPVVFIGGRLFLMQTKSQDEPVFLLKFKWLKSTAQSLCPQSIYKLLSSFFAPIYRFILKNYYRYIFKGSVNQQEITNEYIKNSGDGDNILLLLDSTWLNNIWPAVDEFKSSGGSVVAVLYDLIPFSHPETVEEKTKKNHKSFWLRVPQHVDSVVCISKAVREEFIEWQDKQKLKRKIAADKVKYFHLGSELSTQDPFIDVLSSSLPYYLMVGSIEPRKNHAFVLDTFDQLWADGQMIQLVIVGVNSWGCEGLIKRIEEHAEYNKKLFLIRNASDRDLIGLYKNSKTLIIASIAEGFGLPIIEAMGRGIDVICSDIPVFREVGGQWPTYFNLDDKYSLANAIRINLTTNEKHKVSHKHIDKLLTWKQSTLMLLNNVSLNEPY